VKYVEHLSDFYRELLNHRDLDVISLKQELDLLKSYIFILDQRFANKLFVNIKVAEKFLTKNIAALSLQLLVENAIKHNEVSREKPLVIDIYIEGDSIVVTNKKQKHTHEIKSTKIGLENIKNRYKLFSNKSIEIIDDDNNFTVKLPLID
jgi:LytS/YehU family sensor histidine kinase